MTLAEMRDMVRSLTLVEDVNVPDADINMLINQGLHEVSVAFPWPWLEALVNLSFVKDVPWTDLPSNFDFAISLWDNEKKVEVAPVSAKVFFDNFSGTSEEQGGDPSVWTIFDNKIYVHPTPNDNMNDRLALAYYSGVSELAFDSDEPPFHKGFHMILVEYAKWKLWEREEYFEQSERALLSYSRYLDNMRSWYANPGKRIPFLWGDGLLRGNRVRHSHLPILDEI